MISVIIPVLNESETICSVVEFARRQSSVSEVIVVDDGSIDGTPELARAAGANVITSTLLGKGASMEDGVWTARNEFLLFLDGDLTDLDRDLIPRMIAPLADGNADFVKARFSRRSGRVTTLTARPLLRSFFPELAHFDQPLGGIIAARRSLLRRIRFENDYGVDIGLLLDASAIHATIEEVDIGHIEHDSQPLDVLGDMATQVVRTILDRAARYGRLHMSHIREVEEIERSMQSEMSVVLRRVGRVDRLALFDMDGTLLKGRFVVRLAQRTNKSSHLAPLLDNLDLTPEQRTCQIAALFAGVPKQVIEETARNTPLMPDAVDAVVSLRKAGYRVGIVTDSYHLASEIVRRRVFADFSLAHVLKVRRGKATGEITLSPAMFHPAGCTEHSCCKVNVMHHLIEQMQIGVDRVLAVGDGDNDVCLLRAAGSSVAFRPKSVVVANAASRVVIGSLLEVATIGQSPIARSA